MNENKKWVTCWCVAPVRGGIHLPPVLHLNNGLFYSTARTVLTPTLSGEKVRLSFSNRYGKKPLRLSAVSVGEIKEGTRLQLQKTTAVTFRGSREVIIPPGEDIQSDIIDFRVRDMKDIAVSIYVKHSALTTKGLYGSSTYLSPGNHTDREGFFPMWKLILKTPPAIFQTNPFLTRVDVLADKDSYAVVVAGDSTVANDIPLLIAKRLRSEGRSNVAVLRQAIAGNRILDDGKGIIGNLYGEKLLTRFPKDIATLEGVRTLILKEGINDIIHPHSLSTAKYTQMTTAEDVIEGTRKIIEMAKAPGWKVYVSRKTPLKGFGKILFVIDDFKWTEEIQKKIDALDSWIEKTDEIDGCINVDAFKDEKDVHRLKKELTKDYIHYNKKGQELFASLVPEEYL